MHTVCFLLGEIKVWVNNALPWENIHENRTVGTKTQDPVSDLSLTICPWAFTAATLRCTAQVCWLYPSVSCNLAARAMFNTVRPWWIYCSNAHAAHIRGLPKLALTMTPLELTHILWPRRETRVSQNIRSYKSRFVRRNSITKERRQKRTYPTQTNTIRFLSTTYCI